MPTILAFCARDAQFARIAETSTTGRRSLRDPSLRPLPRPAPAPPPRLLPEPVADAVHGVQQLRVRRIALELLAQLEHVRVDRARRRRRVVAPHGAQQVVARAGLAAVPQQMAEQIGLLRQEPERLAAA